MTGLMLTTPGGTKFWHPCPDPTTGMKHLDLTKHVYGPAWGHAETVIDFGRVEGDTFTAAERVYPKPA